jgi:hypothetical protein
MEYLNLGMLKYWKNGKLSKKFKAILAIFRFGLKIPQD